MTPAALLEQYGPCEAMAYDMVIVGAGLAGLAKWMAQQAEGLGTEMFSGFAAAEVVHDDNGAVQGVATGNQGIGKDGEPTENFQLGMELDGRYTVFAEGTRGHLGKQVIARFGLGVGYANPWLRPFEEMQRWKTHPAIRAHLEGGERIGHGARAITACGQSSLPKRVPPGGRLGGCDAGFSNATRIQGCHVAIKTGLPAAKALAGAIHADCRGDELSTYRQAFEKSWLHHELHQSRTFKAWFKKELRVGTLMTGDTVALASLPAVADSGISSFVGAEIAKRERPDLTAAKIIVSGGRGLGSAARFQGVMTPLADKLGAASGASRATVDAGYAANGLQVGPTGKIVAPRRCTAVDISNAIQHPAGMKDPKVIVAVNKDPEAPIFRAADHGLVGSPFDLVRDIVAELGRDLITSIFGNSSPRDACLV